MMFARPVPLGPEHRLEAFGCGKTPLDVWLARYARQAEASGSARTFIVEELTEHSVAGYFSLTVGQVDILEAPDRVRKGMGRFPIPVILLARLAVASACQGQGIGYAMLQDVIRRSLLLAELVGIRALLTHPIDAEAERFYLQYGFIPSPLREQQLLLLLKDARKLVPLGD